MLRLIIPLCALLCLPAETLAQRSVTTCRNDGHGGRDCWSRPYDRDRFRREERRWDERVDERRLREEMEWDRRRWERSRW